MPSFLLAVTPLLNDTFKDSMALSQAHCQQVHNRGMRPTISSSTLLPAIHDWWEANARALPWRAEGTSAWGVLVSEVMSQQTPMTRVVPYWTQWMAAWPTPEAMKEATSTEILTAWGTLGYPSRALRLRDCAAAIVERFGGVVPSHMDDLLSLPGVGEYTASAVASFYYHRSVAVVDTNIRRVQTRAFLGEESFGGATTKKDRELANSLLPSRNLESSQGQQPSPLSRLSGGDQDALWNEALMEIGATICTAKNPQCEQCPFVKICAFKKAGYPHMGEKRTRPAQKFQGTDRQVRGLVLKALRNLPSGVSTLSEQQWHKLWDKPQQLEKCVAALVADKLIEREADGSIHFPRH